MNKYYQQSIEEILSDTNSDAVNGLSEDESVNRLTKYGKNIINTEKKVSIFKLLLSQFSNPIVLILLFAVVLSMITGKVFEGILIGGIVVFMAFIGVYLERNASNAVAKLKSLTTSKTMVIRDGKQEMIDTSEVVFGDLIYLSDGDKVPADARIVSINDAQLNESILTGESIPASKFTDKINEDVIIGDQKNMVFAGTFVVQGNLKAIVTQTALDTQLGRIAKQLSESEEKETPLQKQLNQLSNYILYGTIIICSIIMFLTFLRKEPIIDGIIQSLSLAIAFIPEGLTAVMTVVLALGVREMVKKKAIIKRLLAAEGLGSISLLATDKTGTITSGKMSVEKLWVFDKEIDPNDFKSDSVLEQKLLDVIRFCSNNKGATETALIEFLNKKGMTFELEEREKEHRFSSDLKRMSVVKKIDDTIHSYSKGAPDVLIPLCSFYHDYETNEKYEFPQDKIEKVLQSAEYYASNGYRVLCLAYKEIEKLTDIHEREIVESNLVFLGLVCLIDPLREEVKATVKTLHNAGIKAVMITGDHPAIAKTISIQAGINTSENAKVITGKQLDEYFEGKNSDLTLNDLLTCNVFARVTPDHKNKLIDLYEENNIQAAMAGDGINDAVAVNRAKIGIAVANATDIVKEAADVVVTGSYDALANAVEIGRLVMFRTRLYLHYLLSGNFCQVGIFILALIFNLPFPLTAISLLIINLLTDAAPAMSMAFEKGSKDIMTDKPKPVNEGIINSEIYKSIFILGFISTLFLFAVFYFTLDYGIEFAQTATFSAYIFQKLLRALSARSFRESILSLNPLSNIAILLSIGLGIIVWFTIVYVFPNTFKMESIPLETILIILAFSTILPISEEILKLLKRKKVRLLI